MRPAAGRRSTGIPRSRWRYQVFWPPWFELVGKKYR